MLPGISTKRANMSSGGFSCNKKRLGQLNQCQLMCIVYATVEFGAPLVLLAFLDSPDYPAQKVIKISNDFEWNSFDDDVTEGYLKFLKEFWEIEDVIG